MYNFDSRIVKDNGKRNPMSKEDKQPISVTNPDLCREWDYEKNAPLTPDNITPGSGIKVWWLCPNGHSYDAKIANRTTLGRGCPYCANKKVLPGYNDLATVNPELATEWDYEKNSPLTPTEVLPGTNRKVWWKCNICGENWMASVANRTKKRGCPFCRTGKSIDTRRKNSVVKKGSLLEKHPNLIAQWDYDKNNNLTPQMIPSSTNLKVWWKCDRGHSWESSVYNRINGSGCPICSHLGSSMPEQGIAFYLSKCCKIAQRERVSGKEVDIFLPDYNIAIEYDGIYYHRNKESKDKAKTETLTASGIMLIRVIESDHNYVSEGNIYFKSDNMGVNYAWALEQLFTLLGKQTDIDSFEKIVVDIEKDRLKIRERFNLLIKENSLLKKRPDIASEWNYDRNESLSPDIFPIASNMKVWWVCSKGHEWQACISDRTIGNTGCPFCSNKKLLVGFNDLKTKHPELANEWNYEKNNGIKPEDVINNSQRKAWWVCKKGHEWKTDILSRCQGRGCPYCKNKKVLLGYNDLATLKPDLLKEWNYDKNLDIRPDMVGTGTQKKVWWKCENGHEWESLITNRVKGHGCPFCNGSKAIIGENDLATLCPDLVKEWDYEKNAPHIPEEYTSSSGQKVWWKDSFGHSWKCAISHRRNGTGCPYCAGQKVLAGFNDLATLKPDIAQTWNYTKNKGLTNGVGEDVSTPDKVTASSGMKVWWKCDNDHEWQAPVYNRIKTGCPYCVGNNFPKAVVCVETGIVYNSMAEAEKKTSISRTSIGQCCKGKKQTAGGYHWKYAE